MAQRAFLLEEEAIMQSFYYRLDKQLNPNKIMQDISKMIQEHSKVNKLENTILHIQIKDISYSYDVNKLEELENDQENTMREQA